MSPNRLQTDPAPAASTAPETHWTRLGRYIARGVARWLPPDGTDVCTVTEHTIRLPNWPRALSGLTLVQLSDIHVYEYSSPAYHAALIGQVNALAPDVLVTTGDLIHYGDRYIGACGELLGAMRARLGKWACMGNHDYIDDANGQAIREMLAAAGFHVLINQAQSVESQGARFWISGVDDIRKGQADARATCADVPAGDPHISLLHNPQYAPALARQPGRPDVILSGHTHGGQIKTAAVDWLYRHFLKQPYDYGWFDVLGSKLYVTSGVGSALVAVHHPRLDFALHPFRVNTTPEIACFRFESDAG